MRVSWSNTLWFSLAAGVALGNKNNNVGERKLEQESRDHGYQSRRTGTNAGTVPQKKILGPGSPFNAVYDSGLHLLGATLSAAIASSGVNLPKELIEMNFLDNDLLDFDICPRFQNDPLYYIEGVIITQIGYQEFFDSQLNPDGVSADAPGLCTTTFTSYKSIEQGLKALAPRQVSGEVVRENALGLFRWHNLTYPYCAGETYCGIQLGVTNEDHLIIRPFLDELFGDGSVKGRLEAKQGNRWNRDDMLQSAKDFIAGKDRLEIGTDAQVWTALELHKRFMEIDLSEDEARAFTDLQSQSILLSFLPAPLVSIFGDQLGLPEVNAAKLSFLDRYINKLPTLGIPTFDNLAPEDKPKAAWFVLDSFLFAGGLSVPGVIHAGLGAFYTCLTDKDFDITNPMHAKLLALESIRVFPPVLGVPYIEQSTKQRLIPAVGLAGYDTDVYGADADDFRIRGDFSFYHKRSLNWADAAYPAPGFPGSNHICPGKSASFNMILAFWEALNPPEWSVDPESEIEQGEGPSFWSDFNITRLAKKDGKSKPKPKGRRCHAKKAKQKAKQAEQVCGAAKDRCPLSLLEPKTVRVDDLLDKNGRFRSNLGPRVAGPGDDLPESLHGIFWLPLGGDDDLTLLSFAGSNDGGGLSSGKLQPGLNSYSVRLPGDRTFAYRDKELSYSVGLNLDYVLHFRTNDPLENPTFFQMIHNVFGTVDLPEFVIDFEQTLLSAEESTQLGYPGSVTWNRTSSILGQELAPYVAVQIVGADSYPIQPAYDEWVDFVNNFGDTPGYIHYFEAKKQQ